MHTAPGQSAMGYADRLVVKAPPWHGLVDWDVLFNGLSTGLFMVAGLAELLAPGRFDLPSRVAYPVVLVMLTVDLALLVLDLGDPWRFHHMLRVFKPSSPMSFGTWSLTAFSVPLTLFIAIDLLVPWVWPAAPWLRPTLLIGGIMAAFCAAGYKGVLFSTTAQPGWKDARWLGACFLSGAVLLGGAELLLIAVLGGFEPAAAGLRPVVTVLLLFSLVPRWVLGAEIGPALLRAYGPENLALRFGFVIGLGVLLPLGLLTFADHPAAQIMAVVLIIASEFFTRVTTVAVPRAIGLVVEAGPNRRPRGAGH